MWSFEMAQLPTTFSEDENHYFYFAVLNLCNTHNTGNIVCFNYSVFTHTLESASRYVATLPCEIGKFKIIVQLLLVYQVRTRVLHVCRLPTSQNSWMVINRPSCSVVCTA